MEESGDALLFMVIWRWEAPAGEKLKRSRVLESAVADPARRRIARIGRCGTRSLPGIYGLHLSYVDGGIGYKVRRPPMSRILSTYQLSPPTFSPATFASRFRTSYTP